MSNLDYERYDFYTQYEHKVAIEATKALLLEFRKSWHKKAFSNDSHSKSRSLLIINMSKHLKDLEEVYHVKYGTA